MTPEMYQKAYNLLLIHEENRKRAYIDIFGNITAGIGHNLSARDIEEDIRLRWARNDIYEFYDLWRSTFPWFIHLNEARQIALIDFAFMGWKKVLGFENMLNYLSHNDMDNAANELLDSEYEKQVGQRAITLANILRTGEL